MVLDSRESQCESNFGAAYVTPLECEFRTWPQRGPELAVTALFFVLASRPPTRGSRLRKKCQNFARSL